MNSKDEVYGFRKFRVHHNLQAGNNAKIIYRNNYQQRICTKKKTMMK